MSDVENSDDERYANESFENESDNDIAEMTELESESTENSDDDDILPSVKLNTGGIKRGANRFNATRNTDTIPFASSSDEEDDVIVGETLAEINTPSMHFEEELTSVSINSTTSILQEKNSPLKSDFIENSNEFIDNANEFIENSNEFIENSNEFIENSNEFIENINELIDNSNEFIDENEEEEFQKIREMEERYMQQNSAKTPKSSNNNANENSMVSDEEKYLTNDYESEEHEAETDDEQVWEEEDEHALDDKSASENVIESNDYDNNKQQNHNLLDSVESKQTFMGTNSQQANNLDFQKIDRTLANSSNVNFPLDNPNLMQMIQETLDNLKISSNANENDIVVTSEMLQTNTLMSNNPAAILNPQNIAMALVNAIKSSCLTNVQSLPNGNNEHQEDNEQNNITETTEELHEQQHQNNDLKQEEVAENYDYDEGDDVIEKGDNDIEEIQNNSQISELEYDDDNIYYNSQLDYRITSKTPSSFNSDDYLFHANFIQPFFRTKLTDKLRARPQPRKSMSFSNERMREIERHNQILLRKILTQKPTYTAKNRSAQPAIQKSSSQTNIRPTTSAVNRKKQQRQIDLDNLVLKRKIEAISLRRRPLVSQ